MYSKYKDSKYASLSGCFKNVTFTKNLNRNAVEL